MFRSSYRAHLDLLALAATKANIMISINGLILSFLFISEAFIMTAEPLLEIPTAVFLVTCFISMAFAIFSALPERRNTRWVKDDFTQQRANLLVFEDYTSLTESEYVPAMRETLQDSPLIYDSMIRQLYFLGAHANKRLKYLAMSYRVFLVGLGLSVLLSFVVVSIVMLRDSIPTAAAADVVVGDNFKSESLPKFEGFRPSNGMYEPSGVAQLPDGRLIVVEDEDARPISFVTLDSTGGMHAVTPKREALLSGGQGLSRLGKLNDLEGVVLDKNGYVYATTSYSRTERSGRTNPNREKLVRFKADGERVTDPAMVSNLKSQIFEQFPSIEEASKTQLGGFNVEGLTLNREQDQLWFGLRSPLIDNKAVILELENQAEVFDGADARFTKVLLDLEGDSVRSIAYIPKLNGYLIISRQEEPKKSIFKMWFWSGEALDDAVKVTVNGVDNLRRAEGITPVEFGESSAIMIFSDEGNALKKKPGQYILLQYDQLSVYTKQPENSTFY